MPSFYTKLIFYVVVTNVQFLIKKVNSFILITGTYRRPVVFSSSSSLFSKALPVKENVNKTSTSKALFGMGCFWNPQEDIASFPGVKSTTSGYVRLKKAVDDNDDDNNEHKGQQIQFSLQEKPASYFSVCTGDGRTESILVEFNPSIISYKDLLSCFWVGHDASKVYPPEKSNQYRSVIWPLDGEQRVFAMEEYSNAREAYQAMDLDPPLTIIADVPNKEEDIDQWIQREFRPAERIHQKFWTKFKLKIGAIATALLFQESNNSFMKNVFSPSLLQFVFIWLAVELVQLGLAAAESSGLKKTSSPGTASPSFNIFKLI